jgi:DNA invertase Pin-like site-specific DNA recombinase
MPSNVIVAARNSGRRSAATRAVGAKEAASISRGVDPSTKRHATARSNDPATFANAIGYLRVSTDDQAESGLGLEAQRASITAAAARLHLSLTRVVIEAGVSGALALTERPALLDAVSALGRGEVLLVAKRDRLGRDVLEVALIEKSIAARGARVVSAAGEGTDNDEPNSLLMRRLMDSFAEYERLVIRARTKAALAAKRARGERIGNLPFGVQLAEDEVHLEPAPVEQRLLARIRALRDQGLTTRQIAADLNAEGHRTRRGTAWRFQYVARNLKRTGTKG